MAPRWGNGESEVSTFLDKVEEGVNALREELVRLFGEHSSIHNVTSDFKAHILGAAALHFGEVQPSAGEAGTEITHTEQPAQTLSGEGIIPSNLPKEGEAVPNDNTITDNPIEEEKKNEA